MHTSSDSDLVFCVDCGSFRFAYEFSGRADRRQKCQHSNTIVVGSAPELMASFHEHVEHARANGFRKKLRGSYSDVHKATSVQAQLDELWAEVDAIQRVLVEANECWVQMKALLVSALKSVIVKMMILYALLNAFAEHSADDNQYSFEFTYKMSVSPAGQ